LIALVITISLLSNILLQRTVPWILTVLLPYYYKMTKLDEPTSLNKHSKYMCKSPSVDFSLPCAWVYCRWFSYIQKWQRW